jgi:hypothetical protein
MKQISHYNPNDMSTNQGTPLPQCRGCQHDWLGYCRNTHKPKPEPCLLSPSYKKDGRKI